MKINHESNELALTADRTWTKWVTGVFGLATVFVAGCAMCCGPYDYHYPNHGGAVQRADPVWGRVGSIYSDPGPFGGPHADHNLVPHEATRANDSGLGTGDGFGGDLNPPDSFNGNTGDDSDNSEILPPPRQDGQRPGPDETSAAPLLRNQSMQRPRQWR